MRAFLALDNRAWAGFLARVLLGLLFFQAGVFKTFQLGPTAHARRFFLGDPAIAASWIPDWLLWALGTAIPLAELAAGLALILGLLTRWAMIGCGLLLLLTTYGHTLQNPLFDIDGHTFTRMALILFWLMLPAGTDRLSLEARFTGK